MKRSYACKGQIFIFILLVMLGLVIVSVLISSFTVRVKATPNVKEAIWLMDGQRVSKANLGEELEVHVVIQATEEYNGSIVVKIRKDVKIWFDSDLTISTLPLNLAGGDEETIEISFTPDEASRGGLTGLRGYFVEIEFKATKTTWEMENSYPPRLAIEA